MLTPAESRERSRLHVNCAPIGGGSIDRLNGFKGRAERWPRWSGAALGAAFAAGASLVASVSFAVPVTLGAAADYALLMGVEGNFTFLGGSTIVGNVGVGQNGLFVSSSSTALQGVLYEDNGVTNLPGGLVPTGGTVTGFSLAQAISDAQSAALTAAMMAPTPGLTGQGGAINVTNPGNSVTVKALTNLGDNVLHVTDLDLHSGNLTLDGNGFAGAKFVVDVTGSFQVSGSANIFLAGGLTPADVLFNIEGTGPAVTITGSASGQLNGTILAPQRNVSLSEQTLTGAVIAGLGSIGQSYTIQDLSGFQVQQMMFVDAPSPAPEPASIALLGAGLAGLSAIRRRKKP